MNKKILSGMQATGRLHIGHYFGVLMNYVRLQEEYDCYFMVANLHSLTAFYPNYRDAHKFIAPLVSDWLAAGINPDKAAIFVQSDVPQHSELALILSMYTPTSWLTRNPTYKEKQENIDKDIDSYGFLGYPVLQAADIFLYESQFVPIGEDQLPHLELSREIARRFNHYNSPNDPVLVIPQPLLSQFPKVLGTDGRKMSKSYGNTIDLADSEDVIDAKLKKMKTDTGRVRRTDPGNPENCPVFSYYDFFDPGNKEYVAEGCRSAALGCSDCKALLSVSVKKRLEPFRKMRQQTQENPSIIQDVLTAGAAKAEKVAQTTMTKIKDSMGLSSDYSF